MSDNRIDQMSKQELLKELQESEKKLQIALTQIVNPSINEKKETRTFSLTDSELKKFEDVGKKYGYKNRSQFLAHLIEKL